MKVRAGIFDFDGVINDSASQKMGGRRIVQIVKRGGCKIPESIYKKLKRNWGLDGKTLIETCFGLDSETAGRIYREWERVDTVDFFPLIPGAKRVLEKLKSGPIKISLLTSRNRENLLVVLDYFGLTELFDLIQAKDDYLFSKPDPRVFDAILANLSKSGVSSRECLYIGDTVLDFKCTTEAGIRSVSVTTGSFNKSDFLRAGQKRENIIRSIADLPKWIEGHQDC